MTLSLKQNNPEGIICPDWEPDPLSVNPRACKNYSPNGACTLPTHLMCVEWERRFGKDTSARLPPAPRPADASDALAPTAAQPPPAQALLEAPGALDMGALAPTLAPTHLPMLPPLASLLATPVDAKELDRRAGGVNFALAPPAPKPLKPTRPATAQEKARAAFELLSRGFAPPAEGTGEGIHEVKDLITDERIRELEELGVDIRMGSPEHGEFWLVAKPTGQDRHEVTFRGVAMIWAAALLFDAKVTMTWAKK
jgi:hypothetical protein